VAQIGEIPENGRPGPGDGTRPGGGGPDSGTGGGGTPPVGGLPDSGTGDVGPPPPSSCTGRLDPGSAPIRRMTRFEYNNTIRDLLGDTTSPAAGFGAEEEALGFNNNAANLVTSATLAEKYMLAAEGIAVRAADPMSGKIGCTTADDACARQFIAQFGKRAFRRPLTTEESNMFFGWFDTGRTGSDFRSGIQMVIETALQSPPFLYRVEFGLAPKPGEKLVRVDAWETASRLSYLIWGSMPDDALFAAADAGQLVTSTDVAAEARRMLDDPKARQAIGNFHEQWLDYNRLASVGKDAALFPEWSTAVGDLMHEETAAFIEDVIFEGTGDLTSLLTAPYTFMNADLAKFYGVPGPAGQAFVKVQLDPAQRAGIMTLGSLLTINAHSNQTSPVHRGKLVRELLLCDQMPPPPPDVMITAPEPDPKSTARERFAQHSAVAACRGCHALMDPLGFGFENYDAMGRFRTLENGKAIDASGSITESDVDGAFVGVVDLSKKLAASKDVRNCYTAQWFRFAFGRGETDLDACTLSSIGAAFAAKQGNIKELLVAFTQTDAFLYRRVGGAP
jgi:hypothetical protein